MILTGLSEFCLVALLGLGILPESLADHTGKISESELQPSSSNLPLKKGSRVLYNWQENFRDQANLLAQLYAGQTHAAFANASYAFFTNTYPDLRWFVIGYDPVESKADTYVSYYRFYGYHMKDYSGRNFMVAATDPVIEFDKELAQNDIVDRNCTDYFITDCMEEAADHMGRASPSHGLVTIALSQSTAYTIRSDDTRYVQGLCYLVKGWWLTGIQLIYFG